jgi:hypothetical protein
MLAWRNPDMLAATAMLMDVLMRLNEALAIVLT